jgi:hypothetical protein
MMLRGGSKPYVRPNLRTLIMDGRVKPGHDD